MKKYLSLIMAIVVVLSTNFTAEAATNSNTYKSYLKSSKIVTVGSQKVKENVYLSNGREVTSYSLTENGNLDKKLFMQELIDTSTQEIGTRALSSWGENRNYIWSATSPLNSDATVRSSIYANTVGDYQLGSNIHTWGGGTYGIWYGNNPSLANQIVLQQCYIASAIGVGVSLFGSGLSISGTTYSQTGTWSSAPILNTWQIATTHVDVKSHCLALIGTFKMYIEDGSDIYIGSYIYKPRGSIQKSWDNIYYG